MKVSLLTSNNVTQCTLYTCTLLKLIDMLTAELYYNTTWWHM